MKDRHNNNVNVGDVVRVLEICSEFLDVLPEEERPHIAGMLNNEYQIDEFPEEGKASVSIEWKYEDGTIGISGLYLLPHEFELVHKTKIK